MTASLPLVGVSRAPHAALDGVPNESDLGGLGIVTVEVDTSKSG